MWLYIILIGTGFVPSWCLGTDDTTATTSSQCVLPPYPDNGIYEVLNVPDARPGQSFSSAVLTVKCRRGYGIMDQLDTTQQIYCIDGTWYPSTDSVQCVRFCKLDPHPSVIYKCKYPGQGVQECKSYVPPGTLVDPVCNSPIYYSTDVLLRMRCFSGYWNYIARCKAECGRITASGKPLIINGTQAKHGEIPWHVGIYRVTSAPFKQICGGSLVSENVVISAAHCVWTDARKLNSAHNFAVAAGKLDRNWDSEEDGSAQKCFVKEIQISSLFEGVAANFQEDIAVLILTTPVMFTTYIQPVCLNFQSIFNNLQLQHGNLGKVAGWGLTEANGGASQLLKVLEMPFISIDICLAALPPSFRAYVTGDKFCAGYMNGSTVCMGDSGGGIAFPDKELGIDRYYLRGVLSTAPNDENKLCNDHTYSTFTKITDHEELIKDALTASEPICPLFSFQCNDGSCVNPESGCNGKQDCDDGSDESSENCLVSNFTLTSQSYSECGVFDGNENETPPWTAHIRILVSTRAYYHGALISNTHVILCHWSGNLEEITDRFIVGFGEYNSNTSEFAVERHVIKILGSYERGGFNHWNAILKLDQRVEYSPKIRPACLWDGGVPEGFVTDTMFPIWNLFKDGTLKLIISRYDASVLNTILVNETLNIKVPYPAGDWYLGQSYTFMYFSYENKWRLCGILYVDTPSYYQSVQSITVRYKKVTQNLLSMIKNAL